MFRQKLIYCLNDSFISKISLIQIFFCVNLVFFGKYYMKGGNKVYVK